MPRRSRSSASSGRAKDDADCLQQDRRSSPARLRAARHLAPDAIFVSALTGAPAWTRSPSVAGSWSPAARDSTELLVPNDRYDVIARLHAFGHIRAQNAPGRRRADPRLFPTLAGRYFSPLS